MVTRFDDLRSYGLTTRGKCRSDVVDLYIISDDDMILHYSFNHSSTHEWKYLKYLGKFYFRSWQEVLCGYL